MNAAPIFQDANGVTRISKTIVGRRVSYVYEGCRVTGTVTDWHDTRRAPAYPENVTITIDGETCDDGTPNTTTVSARAQIEIL